MFFLLVFANKADGWGERGHDIIARVAARLISSDAENLQIRRPFLIKEHMLGHLANVPDIVWRSRDMDKDVISANGPTHYIDLDYLTDNPTFANLPKTISAAETAIKKYCKGHPKLEGCKSPAIDITFAGSAPWRAAQLALRVENAFLKAKSSQARKLALHVDEALLNGGLLAHFIGDLSQPLHGTSDYDGWESGQGGLHRYFETDVVNELKTDLEFKVYEQALKGPRHRLFTAFPKTYRGKFAESPLMIALALAADSFTHIPTLKKLDKAHSLLNESQQKGGLKLMAKRKLPLLVTSHYEKLIIMRLALAADVLAHIWTMAWEKAEKPDLSGYDSYAYPLTPQFIFPDYGSKTDKTH